MRQIELSSTATESRPTLSSSSVNVRPICADTPSMRNRFADARAVAMRAGSPDPVKFIVPPPMSAISSKECDCLRHSRKCMAFTGITGAAAANFGTAS